MKQIKIPFHPNLKDNLHCFQAALKMILSVLTPDIRYSYASLDRITGYHIGAVTWDIRTMLWLAETHVQDISKYDGPEKTMVYYFHDSPSPYHVEVMAAYIQFLEENDDDSFRSLES